MKLCVFVSSLMLLAAQYELCAARTPTINDRLGCGGGGTAPASRVDTTQRLADFRTQLLLVKVGSKAVSAYIVGRADAHNSEYPTDYDQRMAYISGFQGSAGTAVITDTQAALWTDGRYFLEADEVLDCNWLLMKDGLSDTPTIEEWLDSVMATPGQLVGVDRTLITHTKFTTMEDTLANLPKRAVLSAVSRNPVDDIWTTGRPAQPKQPINALKLDFAGVSWQTKLANLRQNITNMGADSFVVTGLDEVAWLFNLRGSDVDYNPFFLAYAIVTTTDVSLYILDKDVRLTAQPSDNETETTLAAHLNTDNTGSCTAATTDCVTVLEYDQAQVETALSTLSRSGVVFVTYDANRAVYDSVQLAVLVGKSPIALDKSMKNSVERQGMQNSYNRDSAALVQFLAFLEDEIKSGNEWTEVSVSDELKKRREALKYNRGLSFTTIAGYGSNGAIIHYRPTETTDKSIGTDSLFLLDSGGQYLDGTTDVTRTMHYGEPSDYQKECYTRVLMSVIDLAKLRWPKGLYGRQIDAVTRAALWDAGLVYRHGTGHGIGAYLSVHEGPGRIRLASTPTQTDEPLREYQYYSDEPGYYEDGEFGIRLETIMMIDFHTPKYSTAEEIFYQFTPVTYVPFETNLIDYTMMTTRQVEWFNDYNAAVRENILPLIEGDQKAINWLNKRTVKVSPSATCGASATQIFSTMGVAMATVATVMWSHV